MTNEITTCITELYGKPDYKKFTELCNKKIIFRQEFYDILNHSVEYSDVPMEETAAHDFYIKFSTKKKGDFHIEYDSIISISRLIPVVSIHHSFEVTYQGKEKYSSYIFNGFSTHPYCKEQQIFHKKIVLYFLQDGYRILSDHEENEYAVNPGWFNSMVHNQNYYTVSSLLFTSRFYDWGEYDDGEL